ncbi:hypothetical protein TNIN_43501 [Trichonephila inaurata madagascariensis]|uniref:Uncharacterized protein n=1 Tax=Trichonephila inaurata madagascariensis TaxID=2747483 RepID=A0A8X6XX08_9ARAC|nr:hypothetical protein TNIN_43501 [Trichonephila inaurata madagascariensis]
MPCLTFNCNPSNPSTQVAEESPVIESKSQENNEISTPSNSAPLKNNKKVKKRKLKKDSVEDFVFPKKTARPVSPSISEPVATNNSFSDLEED